MFSRAPKSIVIIVMVCLIWALVLALDLVPQLRGDYGWRWPYESPQYPKQLIPLGISLVVFIAVGRRFLQLQRAVFILLWAMMGSVVLTLASIYVTEPDVKYELYTRTISGGTTGWHFASTDMDDLPATLRHWPEFMGRYVGLSSHITTSPPGMPLLYYAASQVFAQNRSIADSLGRPLRAAQCHNDRVVGYSLYPGYSNAELASAWLGILMPLWGALAVLPLYWVGCNLYNKNVARWSVFWWPLVPSALMFTPNPTPIYALLALIVVGLLVNGLRYNQSVRVLAAGFVMSIATFLHFTTLPVLFLAGLFTLSYFWINRNRLHWQRSLRVGGWFGLGLSLIWIMFYAVSGVTFWDVLKQSFKEHLALDRPYLPWVFLHLNDFFMFTGWPLVLLAATAIWQIRKTWPREKSLSEGNLLSFCVGATLLLMDISGTTQGESGRIWLILSPFLLMIAARQLETIENHLVSGVLITITQAVILLILVAFLRVISSGLERPPDHPPPLAQRLEVNPIFNGASWGDVLQLQSFAGQIEVLPDNEGNLRSVLRIWLNWRSSGQLDTPYYLAFLPVAPNGQSATQATLYQPFDSQYPLTCWLPTSEAIEDYYEIPLFESEEPGDWWLSISLINGQTGKKLRVRWVDGTQDEQVGIGPFKVLNYKFK